MKNLGANLIKQIAKGFSKPIETPIVSKEQPVPSVVSDVDVPYVARSTEAYQPTDLFGNTIATNDSLHIEPIAIDVTLSNGSKIPLTIRGEKCATEQGLYSLTISANGNYTTTINLKNPIFERFEKSLATPEGQEQLAYMIEVMVATEISLAQGGDQVGKYFRDKFNSLFGVI